MRVRFRAEIRKAGVIDFSICIALAPDDRDANNPLRTRLLEALTPEGGVVHLSAGIGRWSPGQPEAATCLKDVRVLKMIGEGQIEPLSGAQGWSFIQLPLEFNTSRRRRPVRS